MRVCPHCGHDSHFQRCYWATKVAALEGESLSDEDRRHVGFDVPAQNRTDDGWTPGHELSAAAIEREPDPPGPVFEYLIANDLAQAVADRGSG